LGTALLSRSGKANATLKKLFVSQGNAMRLLRDGEKYYTYFVDIYCCFQHWKNFRHHVFRHACTYTTRYLLHHVIIIFSVFLIILLTKTRRRWRDQKCKLNEVNWR